MSETSYLWIVLFLMVAYLFTNVNINIEYKVDKNMDEIYNEGYNYFYWGMDESDCPRIKPEEREEWLRGYYNAKDEAKELS